MASAVIAAVTRFPEPNSARSAAIRFRKASRPLESQVAPQAFGYSQSMSMPSKTSAHRLFSTSSWQDRANAAGSFAASPKPPDQVQPPKDHRIFRPGCFCFSSRSWLKVPRRGWSQVSATPSTDSAAV